MLFNALLLGIALLLVSLSSTAAVFVVSSNADSGPGTLREAMANANSTPGVDQIHFALTGSTVITLNSNMYSNGYVEILGNTQPGFSGTPMVEIVNSRFVYLNGQPQHTIKSLILNGNNSSYGIYAPNIKDSEISNCVFKNASYGMFFPGNIVDNLIKENTYINCTSYGILIQGTNSYGTSIIDNDFSNLTNTAVYSRGSLKEVSGNDFSNVNYPLDLQYQKTKIEFSGLPSGPNYNCLLYTSPSPRDQRGSRMPSSA